MIYVVVLALAFCHPHAVRDQEREARTAARPFCHGLLHAFAALDCLARAAKAVGGVVVFQGVTAYAFKLVSPHAAANRRALLAHPHALHITRHP